MILDDLVKVTKRRIKREKKNVPFKTMKQKAINSIKTNPNDIYKSFLQPGIHIIGEVKKASPSKGIIVNNFPYQEIAQKYDHAGVSAISVLTEPNYFQGHINFLKAINKKVNVPLLRKDFTIDSYMIYQAKAAGAKIILLIIAILTPNQVKQYLSLAHQLGLAVIVEAHDAAEIHTAINVGARMIGVNNRNLKNFTTSFQNSIKLRKLVPESIAFIAESGVKNLDDIHQLAKANVNGILIGETLMKSNNKEKFIEQAIRS